MHLVSTPATIVEIETSTLNLRVGPEKERKSSTSRATRMSAEKMSDHEYLASKLWQIE